YVHIRYNVLDMSMLSNLEEIAPEEELVRREFRGGMIVNQSLSKLDVDQSSLNGSRLIGCDCSHSHLRNVVFMGCDLSNTKFTNSALTSVEFKDCKLLGTSFAECSFKNVTFNDCLMELSQFSHSKS